MPKGGAGRHYRPTPAPGKDAPRCALGDGKTAIRSVAGVPLCRQHAGAAKQAAGSSPTLEGVRAWVQARQGKAAEPAMAAPATTETGALEG